MMLENNHFVHNLDQCACAEGFVVQVLACKCQFVHDRGPCA